MLVCAHVRAGGSAFTRRIPPPHTHMRARAHTPPAAYDTLYLVVEIGAFVLGQAVKVMCVYPAHFLSVVLCEVTRPILRSMAPGGVVAIVRVVWVVWVV